jgi:hypothetical protein
VKLKLTLLALVVASSLNAQRIGLRAGYRFGYAFMNQLNTVIDDYNKRPEVVTHMPDMHTLRGPAAGFGLLVQEVAVNLGWMAGTARVSATFHDSLTGPETNELLVKSTSFRLEFAQFPEPEARFAFSFAFAAEYSPVRLYLNSPSQPNHLLDHFHLVSVSPNAQLYLGLADNLFIWLNPYYQLYVVRADLSRVYNLMVPNGSIDPNNELPEKLNNFGIVSGIMLSFGD